MCIYIYIIYSFFTSLLSDYINGVFEASVEIWGKIPLASPGCRDKEGNRENQHGNCLRLNPCPPRAARGIPSGIRPLPSHPGGLWQIFGAGCPIPWLFRARSPSTASPRLCLCLIPGIWDLGRQAPHISPGFPSYSLCLCTAPHLNPRSPQI